MTLAGSFIEVKGSEGGMDVSNTAHCRNCDIFLTTGITYKNLYWLSLYFGLFALAAEPSETRAMSLGPRAEMIQEVPVKAYNARAKSYYYYYY